MSEINVSEVRVSEITVLHDGVEPFVTTPEDMAMLAGGVFPLDERVPGAEGEAFDWGGWYDAFRMQRGLRVGEPVPSHLLAEAADGFRAVIPWEQLPSAAVLFRLNGAPLPKGGPVRLFVPNGTSACLNVKSVVVFRIVSEPERGAAAEYGFKSSFSPEELRRK